MRFPLRRVLLGFTLGAAAGWAAGLLRRPADAPAGSSAESAIRLPQEEFGEPAGEHPPPRKATGPSIRPTPGAPHPEVGDGGSEPATPPHAEEAVTVTASAAEALREGHAAAAEQLAEAVENATPAAKPARRRRPPAQPKG
ncbi:MAG: hypothetical protein QOE45_3239 [Frankiaceae bacterium]|jgi:hypothetical protein|nr:hypothetical protein [Frankiaceae bacterium]